MHSRIFQIEEHPVAPDDRITEHHYNYDHWFFYNVADYVAEDGNRTASLEWLRNALKTAGSCIEFFTEDNCEGFVLHEGFHAAYFESIYQVFCEKLSSLLEHATLAAFADGSLQPALFAVEEAYDDKYGFYIDSDESGLVTLNKFLRNAKTEKRYYFGGTVDYHC